MRLYNCKLLLPALLLAAPACTFGRDPISTEEIVQAVNPEPDPASPIGQKWLKLGGKSVVGDAIREVGTLSLSNGKYQEFEHGVIVYSDDFGALFMPATIFARWRASGTEDKIGLPMQDAVDGTADIAGQLVAHTLSVFERGVIVRDGSDVAFLVEGVAAREYMKGCEAAETRCGWQKLGNPVDEATVTAVPPIVVQHFTDGAVYYDGEGGAALWGPIYTKYAASSLADLGRPTVGPRDVKNGAGNVVGQVAFFANNAAIFLEPGTGAHLVSGPILSDYTSRFGGPAGWLGMPIGDTAGPAGDEFTDFQRGMLINHSANDGFKGVNAFGELSLKIAHAVVTECDGGLTCSNETYVVYDISTSTGIHRASKLCADGGVILCEDGDESDAWDEDITPNKVIPLGTANSNLSISLVIRLRDYDNGFNGDDNVIGDWFETADRTNLFLAASFGIHNAANGNVTFGVQSTHPFDATDFMGNRWWSFSNWSTDDLSYNQFAQAFDDVGPDESVWFHPFNRFWYEAVIRNIADKGNCAGMAIESIYADRGQSAFSEPVHDFFPNTQNGEKLGDVLVSQAHVTMASEINVRHAYQGGADMIRFYLKTLAQGSTHDPHGAFFQVMTALATRQPMMIGLSTFWWGRAHVVRAYDIELGQPCAGGGASPCNRILVADPNIPKVTRFPTFIEVDREGQFFYQGAGDPYSGGSLLGDRMYPIPYIDLLDHQATTPFSIFEALEFATFLIAGSDGSVEQVTSDGGNTFFKPNLGRIPLRFDDINEGPSGLSEFAPIPLQDSEGARMLAVAGHGTYTYDVVASPGVASGTPINLAFNSGYMSARATIPGTPGMADQFTAHNINAPGKAVSLGINPAGVRKTVRLTVGAPDKHRWAELSNLSLAPGQQITVGTTNGGFVLAIDNHGPPTTVDVTVSAGRGATPVVVGTIPLDPGRNTVEYQLPKTTLTLTGQVPGNDDWLLAPVTAELTAKDFSGTGIERIEHRHDAFAWLAHSCPAASATCSTGPFEYAFEGDTMLSYRATDRAHNVEAPKKQQIKIDTRVPVVSASIDKATYTRVEPFIVHATATDPAPGSGLRTVSTTVDGASAADGQSVDLLLFALGTHTVAISAEDVAGWRSSASASFELIATAESIVATIDLLRARGLIDSDGVANSLRVKAELAHWNPLRNELRAQAGNHITQQAADLLDADVAYVMTH
jgi:hypothetical protein